jgi:DNA-binding transcriptional MerR regulator
LGIVDDPSLTIGELAKRTGVAPSAIRYYEELGLMPTAPKVSGKRRYDQAAVESVGVILFLRDVGFSLAEMKKVIASQSRSAGAWRDLARQKLIDLDERISQAKVAQVALKHALRCKHQNLLDCPSFAGALSARLAGKSLAEAHSH